MKFLFLFWRNLRDWTGNLTITLILWRIGKWWKTRLKKIFSPTLNLSTPFLGIGISSPNGRAEWPEWCHPTHSPKFGRDTVFVWDHPLFLPHFHFDPFSPFHPIFLGRRALKVRAWRPITYRLKSHHLFSKIKYGYEQFFQHFGWQSHDLRIEVFGVYIPKLGAVGGQWRA